MERRIICLRTKQNNIIIIQRNKFDIFSTMAMAFEAPRKIVKGIKYARIFVAGRRNKFRRCYTKYVNGNYKSVVLKRQLNRFSPTFLSLNVKATIFDRSVNISAKKYRFCGFEETATIRTRKYLHRWCCFWKHNGNAPTDEGASDLDETRRRPAEGTPSNIALEFRRFLRFQRTRRSRQTDLYFRLTGQTVFSPLHRTL